MIEKKPVFLHPVIWRRVLDALELSKPVLGENPHMKERLALYEHTEAMGEIAKVAKRVRQQASHLDGEQPHVQKNKGTRTAAPVKSRVQPVPERPV